MNLAEADVRVSLWGVEVTERVASVTWTRGGCYEPGVILRGTKASPNCLRQRCLEARKIPFEVNGRKL